MFVRWQNYRSVARWHQDKPVKRCKAVLVKSVRVNSKPRLKHIAFLASYDVEAIDAATRSFHPDDRKRRVTIRSYFWHHVRERLDQLEKQKLITSKDRKKIEAAIARKVRRTTRKQDEALDRENAKEWQRCAAILAAYR